MKDSGGSFSQDGDHDSDDQQGELESLVDGETEEAQYLRKLVKKAPKESKGQKHPKELFVLPLSRRPFFPGMAAPLVIEPGPQYEVLKIVAKSPHKMVGLFLTRSEETDLCKTDWPDLFDVGVLASILRIVPLEQGGAQVVFNMEHRIKLERPIKKSKYLRAKVRHHEDVVPPEQTRITKAYSISIITTIKELLKLNPLFKEELQIFLGHSDFTEPGKLADFAVALTTTGRLELQCILETFDVPERIDKALVLLKKELDLSRLQNSINQKIEATISKTQREFFLREQLKTIKKELGLEKDDKTCDIEKFRIRLKDRSLPEEVDKVIQEELGKLSVLDIQSAEYTVSRNYVDWLTIVPWGIHSREDHQIFRAEKILNEDHYGLEDTKERILELIGVGKLSGGIKGSIICLVGPPGVGKTSIGKSIARAIDRKFFRFSVGGMHDEAEIKGHRRTYIGSMPGKPIQALKYTQAMNPVIMIDEIDKMGTSYQGDPASALLEVLDPEQNNDFLDHYLDVRVDLSNVLFILTANILDTIPTPLLDRMDILRLPGYIKEEKVAIAKQYLIPRHRKKSGLKSTQIRWTDRAISEIIDGYAREAGVRGLEKSIKQIIRKVGLKIVREEEKKGLPSTEGEKGNKVSQKKLVTKLTTITDKNLVRYLGKRAFTTDRYYTHTPVGVCTGLAWTSAGGTTLYVETIETTSDKTEMKLTGQAGEVMKESAQIAWSYVQSASERYAPDIPFFKGKAVHIHIPEGATPKDGPSAGVTMVTALLSLLKKEPVFPDLGMTGELTLTGKVLPIGGLKEKCIAASRVGLGTVIVPAGNRPDFEKLSDNVKKGLEVHFAETYADVYRIAFPSKKEKSQKVHQKQKPKRRVRRKGGVS